MLAHPSPHEVSAPDLAETRQHEQTPMTSNRSTTSHLPLDCESTGAECSPLGGEEERNVSEENKDMVRRMVEAINAGEEDAAVEESSRPGRRGE